MFSKFWQNKKNILLLLGLWSLNLIVYGLLSWLNVTEHNLQTLVISWGWYGPLILFLVQCFTSLTPLPDNFVMTAGILLYGPFWGVLPVVLAMILASIGHFYFARKLGKERVGKRYPQAKLFAAKLTARDAIWRLVLVRNFSVVSFDIAAYVAGISEISLKRFLVSTVVGLQPIIIINVLLTLGFFSNSPWQSVIAFSLLAVLLCIIWLGSRVVKKLYLIES